MLLCRATSEPRHLNPATRVTANPASHPATAGAGINALKQQGHCEGTYMILAGKESNGSPIYKHNT